MATKAKRLITVDEFLAIEWDSSDTKAELDNGVIRIVRMMAGGTADHSRIQGNVFGTLFTQLKGTGCRPHGSDMAVVVGEFSVRYPDVSVFCGHEGRDDGKLKAFDDPKMVVEVLSETTREGDFKLKLPEYRDIASLQAILYIDSESESLHLETRDPDGGWQIVPVRGDTIDLRQIGVALSLEDIFAR
jgi:Uma2 family endonuclease